MKTENKLLLLIALLTTLLASCIHDHPDGAGNRELTLEWQSEHPAELTGIHLWIFGADGLLKESRTFATLDEAQGARLAIPEEACTLVAATCPDSYYRLSTVQPGETTLDDLLITLRDASSNPPHIQSGGGNGGCTNGTHHSGARPLRTAIHHPQPPSRRSESPCRSAQLRRWLLSRHQPAGENDGDSRTR